MFSMQEGESEKGSRGKVAEEVILDLALPVQGFEDISDFLQRILIPPPWVGIFIEQRILDVSQRWKAVPQNFSAIEGKI